ncbi:hypothetical protein GCM10009557_17960 [Virgisporangium ochraceum]|uniref:Amino acid transporter n=1 Tax=Virgisporangium ochraceum TaxID=65505 RepID=A0A8J4A0M2_9ACTN|nr:hypothetical protein [Virgisporangium ochraceum]GIJ72693.1 hypothetical protein Voc01_076100 [Virgisporangium ochraceum]
MTRIETPWGPWQAVTVTRAAELFAHLGAPWFVAGGWAIELAVGGPVREHADIDIMLLRRDQGRLHDVLPGWDIHAADPPGTLRPWPRHEVLPSGVHDVWCRPAADEPWRLQVMLDESIGDRWVSRVDARVTRPVASLRNLTPDGIPYLTPEVQLFYKSRHTRPRDETDFSAVLPYLDGRQRSWLDDALALTAPDHAWRRRLRDSPM